MSIANSFVLPKLRLSPHRVISSQIYDFLREHITETNIKPGMLLSENSLSRHFNVSRQPVREALMRLSYDGLLSVLPQRGSVVERISITGLKETVFVRTAIEKECLLNITNLDVKSRQACLKLLERVILQQKRVKEDENLRANYLRLDDLFHERLCALSGTNMAWNTIQSLKGQMDRIRFLTFGTVTPPSVVTQEHEEILELLKGNEIKGACAALTKHLSIIIETQKPIIKQYSNWFTPESLNILRQEEEAAAAAAAAASAADAADIAATASTATASADSASASSSQSTTNGANEAIAIPVATARDSK